MLSRLTVMQAQRAAVWNQFILSEKCKRNTKILSLIMEVDYCIDTE